MSSEEPAGYPAFDGVIRRTRADSTPVFVLRRHIPRMHRT